MQNDDDYWTYRQRVCERVWNVVGILFVLFMLLAVFPNSVKKEMEYREMQEITGPFYGGGKPTPP